MKKILIACILISIILNVCFSQTAHNINGVILENKSLNGRSLLSRYHNQVIEIGYSAQEFQLVIYNHPIEKKVIGTLKKKDVIKIKEIMTIDNMEIWLKISFQIIDGYILFEKSSDSKVFDFYQDGLWQPLNTIKTNKNTWHTLKCNQGFLVYTNLNIREKPGIDSVKIGMIYATHSNYISITTSEVTVEKENIDGENERWAKINYNNLTGWVFAGYLEYERGGPRFNTPDSRIVMNLGEGP